MKVNKKSVYVQDFISATNFDQTVGHHALQLQGNP